MICIVNIGPFDDKNAGGWRDYELRINRDVVAKFRHKRSDGLAVCLEKAAVAAREAIRTRDEKMLAMLQSMFSRE